MSRIAEPFRPAAVGIVLIATAVIAAAPASALAERLATGTVTITDSAADGAPPAEGVLVTDGHSFVRTDAQGRYELSLDDEARWVLVINPPGSVPERALYQRLPEEEGEVDEAVLEAPVEADFELQRLEHPADTAFTFVHMSDSHIASPYRGERTRVDFTEAFNRMVPQPNFIMESGDLSIRTVEQLEIRARANETLQMPYLPSIGNHDRPREGSFRGATFERLFRPVYHAFTFHDHLFIALPWAEMTPESYEWTRRLLDEVGDDFRVMVYLHHLDGIARGNGRYEQFMSLLREHDIGAIFMGHYHVAQMADYDGIPVYLAGATVASSRDVTRPSFNVVTVEPDGRLRVEQRLADRTRARSLVTPAADGAFYRDTEQDLIVSAYDTSVGVTQVRASIWESGIEGQQLARLELEQENPYLWRAAVTPDDSWTDDVYLIVEIEDAAGQRWEPIHVLRPVAAGERWPEPMLEEAGTDAPTAGDAGAEPPVELAWARSVSGRFGFASPVVRDGVIYLAVEHITEVERENATLVALDAHTGDVQWEHLARGRSVRATPLVHEDVVLAQGDDGTVIGVDRYDGQLRWEDTGMISLGRAAQIFFRSAPLLVGEAYVVVGGGHLYSRLRIEDGAEVWRPEGMTASRLGAPPSPTVSGDTLLVVRGGTLEARDVETGEPRWDKSMRGVGSTPVIIDDTIYAVVQLGGDNGSAWAHGRWDTQAVAIDLEDGELQWTTPLEFRGRNYCAPVVIDGTMLVVDDEDVVGLDIDSGEIQWRASFAEAVSDYERLVAREFTSAAMYEDARRGIVLGEARLVDGRLYFVTRTGTLIAFDVAERELAWSYDLHTYVQSTPAIVGNTIYVAGRNGVLYALVERDR